MERFWSGIGIWPAESAKALREAPGDALAAFGYGVPPHPMCRWKK